MLLAKRDGIACDVCQISYTDDFTYYSYDFRPIRVHDNVMDAIDLSTSPEWSIDVCESCHHKFGELIKKYYRPTPCRPIRHYPEGIYCEFSGQLLKGSYSFYHVTVTKAIVKMSHKPYQCTSCNKVITKIEEVCPQCTGRDFARKADTQTDERHLEIWLSDQASKKLKMSNQKQTEQQKREATQWSSSAN